MRQRRRQHRSFGEIGRRADPGIARIGPDTLSFERRARVQGHIGTKIARQLRADGRVILSRDRADVDADGGKPEFATRRLVEVSRGAAAW